MNIQYYIRLFILLAGEVMSIAYATIPNLTLISDPKVLHDRICKLPHRILALVIC